MNKENSKNFIIQQGAKLFYYRGYKNTELTDIFKECQMPNDIFYKYFSSKEELLIAVIKYHTENLISFFNKNVNDLSISKFHYFFEKYFQNIENNRFHGGSPLGNLALELADINRNVREELVKSYKKIELRFSFFITTLKYAFPEKYADIVPETVARLLISLLEGTILILKTEKENTAIKDFFFFFDNIFRINDKGIEPQQSQNTEIHHEPNQENNVQQQPEISDSTPENIIKVEENIENAENIHRNIHEHDNTENISENLSDKSDKKDEEDQTVGELGNYPDNGFDDGMFYDLDSESLVNVLDNLEISSKNEENE